MGRRCHQMKYERWKERLSISLAFDNGYEYDIITWCQVFEYFTME